MSALWGRPDDRHRRGLIVPTTTTSEPARPAFVGPVGKLVRAEEQKYNAIRQMGADIIRNDVWRMPYRSPLDLDNFGREDPEMRAAYRRYHANNPTVGTALEGKVASIACLDVACLPDDEDNPNDQAAAEWLEWTIDHSEYGWDGLIRNTILPACLDGWSVQEIVTEAVRDRRWANGGPLWGLKHCQPKDTERLFLEIDEYRNVLSVVNRVRGLEYFSPEKIVLFTHDDLFANPFGRSDLRRAYRYCYLIDLAYELWAVALKVYSGPVVWGKRAENQTRTSLELALQALRQGGWVSTDKNTEIEVLNLATAVNFEAFEAKVRILREEINTAIRGAYLPFQQGSSGKGETRGNSQVSKGTGSDPIEQLLAKAVGRCLTRQLAPRLLEPNFHDVGRVRIVLGGHDWEETNRQIDAADKLQNKMGLPVSKKWLYKATKVPPPTDPQDATQPQQPGGAPGAGPGGAPSAVGPGAAPPAQAPGAPPSAAGPGLAGVFADEAVYSAPPASLTVMPSWFQHKPGADGRGLTKPLPAGTYVPDAKKPLVVWEEPGTATRYVVDGHHRYAHAVRDGAPWVPVRFVRAANRDQALKLGMLADAALRADDRVRELAAAPDLDAETLADLVLLLDVPELGV